MQKSYFGCLWIHAGYCMPAQKIIVRPKNHRKFVTGLKLIRSKSIVVCLGCRRTELTPQQRVGRSESHGYWMCCRRVAQHLRACFMLEADTLSTYCNKPVGDWFARCLHFLFNFNRQYIGLSRHAWPKANYFRFRRVRILRICACGAVWRHWNRVGPSNDSSRYDGYRTISQVWPVVVGAFLHVDPRCLVTPYRHVGHLSICVKRHE